MPIERDGSYGTGRIGELLEPGSYSVDAEPYEMPIIRVVDPATSLLPGLEGSSNGLGPLTIGMTLAEGSLALRQEIVVDESLAPGPTCWLAVVPGDPYSPVFTVAGGGSQESIITAISIAYPETRTIGPTSDCF